MLSRMVIRLLSGKGRAVTCTRDELDTVDRPTGTILGRVHGDNGLGQ